MKFLETKGLHIYSTPPALNIKYLRLAGGQLLTPQSVTFSLGCKKSGSDRNEKENAKISLITVFCLEIFSPFTVFHFKHMKVNKTGRFLGSTVKGVTTQVQHKGIHACYHTSSKSIGLMVAWSIRILKHQLGVWR